MAIDTTTTTDGIQNDEQLRQAVSEAGRLLQEIQDYLKRELRPEGQVRFPRGFILPADEYRTRIAPFIKNETLKKNLSCAASKSLSSRSTSARCMREQHGQFGA